MKIILSLVFIIPFLFVSCGTTIELGEWSMKYELFQDYSENGECTNTVDLYLVIEKETQHLNKIDSVKFTGQISYKSSNESKDIEENLSTIENGTKITTVKINCEKILFRDLEVTLEYTVKSARAKVKKSETGGLECSKINVKSIPRGSDRKVKRTEC